MNKIQTIEVRAIARQIESGEKQETKDILMLKDQDGWTVAHELAWNSWKTNWQTEDNEILKLAEKIGIKEQKINMDYKDRSFYKNKPEDLHTDEKFVAALFNSAFEEPLAGISKDGDVRRIFNIGYGLIASEDLMPYNKPLIKALQRNPITLYAYSFSISRWEAIKTNKLWTEGEFVIGNTSEKESLETRARVIGKLKEMLSSESLARFSESSAIV